jgi:hypothetical protein
MTRTGRCTVGIVMGCMGMAFILGASPAGSAEASNRSIHEERTHCANPSTIAGSGAKGTWNADGTCTGFPEATCGYSV